MFFLFLLSIQEIKISIPVVKTDGDSGNLIVKVLDENDKVVGSYSKFIYVKKEIEYININIRIKESDTDILRVKVLYNKSEKIYPIYKLMDKMVVNILGQDEFTKGTEIKHRIIVKNMKNDSPIMNANVKVYFSDKIVFQGFTNSLGIVNSSFKISDGIKEGDLRFEISSIFGKETFTRKIKIHPGYITYLITDKPIYQPEQVIHIRSLTLKKPELKAVSDEEVIFEIEDSKGNKIFKKKIMTDKFGVASTDFTLADEINFGDYTIRTIIQDETVEKNVKVSRYILPKFKIELKTDKDYYLPGEELEGTITADYFFGKPVTDGNVKINVYKFDIGFDLVQEIKGKLDNNGLFNFKYRLPEYFVGEPLEKGDAFVRFEIEVEDNTKHTEKIDLKKMIKRSNIEIFVIPEGGEFKKNLPNNFYVFVTYPDGKPCISNVTVHLKDRTFEKKTDSLGIAKFQFTPKDDTFEINVQVKDKIGNIEKIRKSFWTGKDEQVMMILDKGIYKVGDILNIKFLTTKNSGRLYFDIIKDNQTQILKSLDINNGKATISINLTNELSGSLWLHSYIVTKEGFIIRDSRFIYVEPQNELQITMGKDKKEYLPGEDAILTFSVKDKKGLPVVSSLCIAIVDEAVFAVSELRPGLEKVYFLLEEEILKPRYEIHNFKMERIVQEEIKPEIQKIMFSTLSPKEPFMINYRTKIDMDKLKNAYIKNLYEFKDKIYAALNKYYDRYNEYPKSKDVIKIFIKEGFLKEKDIKDPWGNPYKIISEDESFTYVGNIISAGPDGTFDTDDDIDIYKYEHERIKDNEWSKVKLMVEEEVAFVPMDKKETVEKEELRVREYFPETFIFEPALITDKSGLVKLEVKMPDAITTWRVTGFGSTISGSLGSFISDIRVFQDFFVDIDLPLYLTEGDEISIPVAIYNYLPKQQNIKIVFERADWFEFIEGNTIERTLKKDEITVEYFPIRVKKIGYFPMLVKAYGEIKSDAIKRFIKVLPDGKRFENIISERLDNSVVKKIVFPKNAIKDGNALILKIYPGIFSQVVDGLDKMLRMPFGCFEQTSSVTYPNILILKYLRDTKQIKPDIEMKAEEYLSLGYQRLLSYEVKSGGFSWFGNEPANKILTAYGLMEFYDMNNVFDVDINVIERTKNWLKSQQNNDGSWSKDNEYLHAESWERIQKTDILPTAYVVWALSEVGDKSDAVKNGLKYIHNNLKDVKDPYTLSIIANALVSSDPKNENTNDVLKKLISLGKESKDEIYWESEMSSITFSSGKGADIEATGLAIYAIIKSGKYGNIVTKGLNYLIKNKDTNGMWSTTQGTIIALKCFVASLGNNMEDANATITIDLNGKKIKDVSINNENIDVVQQISFNDIKEENIIEINKEGEGNFLYELTSYYYIPWNLVPKPPLPLFDISVKYDKTELELNDIVKVNVKCKLKKEGKAEMVIIDLGIPPGFSVLTPSLDEIVGKNIQKYNLTPRQIIIYVEQIESKKPLEFSYMMKAKYPIKAKSPTSRIYEYYNNEQESIILPVEFNVKK